MNQVFGFLASNAGRILRAVAGLILIALGIWLASGVLRWVLIIVGLVPLAAGIYVALVFLFKAFSPDDWALFQKVWRPGHAEKN